MSKTSKKPLYKRWWAIGLTALLSIDFCQNLLSEKAVASAHELWREGKQTDAMEKYRFALDNVSGCHPR